MKSMKCKYVNLTYQFNQSGKVWRGVCVELGTSVMGKSEKDVQTKLKEAVLCHINTLEDVGERERFFNENGIVLQSGELDAPEERTIEVRNQIVPVPC